MNRTIQFILALICLSSCSSAFDLFDPSEAGNIQGTVTDAEGNPINHIKVTLNWEGSDEQLSVYTSSKGEFIADLKWEGKDTPQALDILLEDIDGEENGGLFTSLQDRITMLEDEKSDVITLSYRMTLSIVSENTPQSL